MRKKTNRRLRSPPLPLSSFNVSYLVFPKHMLEENLVGELGCHGWSALSLKIRNLADLRCPACHWESLPMKFHQISASGLEYNPVGVFTGRSHAFPQKYAPEGNDLSKGNSRSPPRESRLDVCNLIPS